MNATYPVPWQPCGLDGWRTTQAKHAFDISLGKMLQPIPNHSTDVETPYIRAIHVQWDRISIEDLPTMWASPNDLEQLRLKVGDLLVCEGGEVGRAAVLEEQTPRGCIFQNALHRVRAANQNDLRYLKYCLKQASETGWFDVLCNRATIAHFTVEKFRELRIHLPSPNLQRLIADYLDRETARIDALVAEKEQMLALLEEKRAALINHAVTRGLNPNAPLKPSGLDWLGDIPTHWDIRRLKFVSESLSQGSSPVAANSPAEPDELGVLKLSAVNKGRFKREENKALRESDESEQVLSLRKGDILITRGNTPDLVADVAYVPSNEPNLLLPDLIYRMRVKGDQVVSEFLAYFLTTQNARVQIQRDARGSSGSMVKVSQGHVLAWQAPVPPIAEQREIVTQIQTAENKSEALCNELSESIYLLKERRAALITAAVTGRIPVEEMTA